MNELLSGKSVLFLAVSFACAKIILGVPFIM